MSQAVFFEQANDPTNTNDHPHEDKAASLIHKSISDTLTIQFQ